jgi:hypothetical protein
MGPATTAGEGQLPNLIVAGVSRAGTTSLFRYLGQHPEVCPSDIKELRYFTPLRYGEQPGPVDEYAGHFRRCPDTKYRLEATPGYFYGGRALARGILEVCPADVRVVVSLRSPVDRCWSWFSFVKSRLRIPQDMSFDEYVERCHTLHLAGVDDRVENQPYWGLGGGCYARWLDSWVEEYGDNLRIVMFDDLSQDAAAVTRDLYKWLEVDEHEVDQMEFDAENRARPYRRRALHRVAVSVNRRTESYFQRHPRTKRLVRRGYYLMNHGTADSSMSPDRRASLEEFYRPHNQALEAQLAPLGLALPASWQSVP